MDYRTAGLVGSHQGRVRADMELPCDTISGAIAQIYCKLAHRFSLISASPRGGASGLAKNLKNPLRKT